MIIMAFTDQSGTIHPASVWVIGGLAFDNTLGRANCTFLGFGSAEALAQGKHHVGTFSVIVEGEDFNALAAVLGPAIAPVCYTEAMATKFFELGKLLQK